MDKPKRPKKEKPAPDPSRNMQIATVTGLLRGVNHECIMASLFIADLKKRIGKISAHPLILPEEAHKLDKTLSATIAGYSPKHALDLGVISEDIYTALTLRERGEKK